ncbi:MAG: MFS transporter [Cyanobium sp.]
MGSGRAYPQLSAFLTLLNDRMGESMVFPLLPYLLADLVGDGRQLGLVVGLLGGSYAVAQFCCTPLIGALSDRFGRRPVISVCVAGTVLGLALFCFTILFPWQRLWPAAAKAGLPLLLLFVARLIDGMSGGTAATASAVLAESSPPEQRARAFGLIGVAFGLGFILGPGLSGLLAAYSAALPLLVALAFAGFNLVVVLTLLPETHPIEARIALPRRRELLPTSQVARVLGRVEVRRLGMAFFLFFLAFSAFTSILVVYFKQVFGWGPGLATTAFVVVGVVATLVQGGLIGPLVRRCGEWRLCLAGTGLVIAGCSLIAQVTAAQAVAVVFPALALLACGTGLLTPCLRSLVSRRLDADGQGAALGSLQGLQSLGSFLGPWLAGAIYLAAGPRGPFWLGIALLLAVAALVAGGQPGRRPGALEHIE